MKRSNLSSEGDSMALFTEVFKRKEVKYVLDERQCSYIQEAIGRLGGMAPDAYGASRITSLYLDTEDRLLVRRSLDKPLYKEKLRLRWYGNLDETSVVFIELKKKYKGVVYKRRVGCSLAAVQAYLSGMAYEEACTRFPLADQELAANSLSKVSLQNIREIDQAVQRYCPLYQSMLIATERTAYAPVPKEECSAETDQGAFVTQDGGNNRSSASVQIDSDVRITFDKRLAYRDLLGASQHANSGAHVGIPLLPPDQAIMEVKVSGVFPLWLSHALAECNAYPNSFSKYGEAYLACMREKNQQSYGRVKHRVLADQAASVYRAPCEHVRVGA